MARYGKVISNGIEITGPFTPLDDARDLLIELSRKGCAAELVAYRGPKPDRPPKQLATEYGSMDVARVGAGPGGLVHLISHAGEFAICGAGGSRAALNPRRYIHYADVAEYVTCDNCKRVVEAAKAAAVA